MKKYLLLSLCLILRLGAFAQDEPQPVIPVLNDNAEIVINPNTNYSYTLKFTVIDGTNNCSVKCSQFPNEEINLEIPSEVKMGETVLTVTSIENHAFDMNYNYGRGLFIGNLVIPNSVTSIGDYAFNYFSNFNGTLTLSEKLETIGQYAFNGCSNFIGDLVIPNSVTSIGNYAFQNCSSFNGTLTLSEKLKTIGQYAFQYCSGFDFIVSAAITPPTASSNTFSNTNLSTLYVQEEAVSAYSNKSPWYNFNIYAATPFISNLKESSFSCSAEKYFDIEMFNCSMEQISSIKFEVLVDDVKVNEFTWEGNINAFKVENIEFKTELAAGYHELTVNVTEINGVEFANSITIEVFSEDVKYVYVEGDEEEFTIDIMKFIDDDYYGTTISWELYASDNSFIDAGNTRKTSILYSDVVSVPVGECVRFVISKNNNYSASGYYRILDSKGNVVVYNEGDFSTKSSFILSVNSIEDVDDSYAKNTFVVDVETPGVLSYKLAAMTDKWNEVYTLKVNGNIGEEDMDMFYKLSNLAVLDLSGTNLTSIGRCHDLGMLRTVVLPSTVTAVEEQAFSNCYSLKSINVPNVTTIGNGAFSSCYSLASIEVPNVETIGNSAFYYCYSLTSIELPKVVDLGNESDGYSDGVFSDCRNLSNVVLSDNLEKISKGLFYYCTSLSYIDLPTSLKSIGEYAFEECPLSSIVIPEGVTTIENYAFRDCPLTNISIPSTIENIGRRAFEYHQSITDVYCYAVAPVRTETFNGGLDFATLHVPATSVVSYRLHDSWYNFENIVPMDYDIVDVNISSDFTIVDYNGYADEVNLNLNMNAHLTVAAGSEFKLDNFKQTTSNIVFEQYDNNNWEYVYYYPSTLITHNEMSAKSVEVSLTLHTDRWNFISLPFDVNVSDITYPEGTLWVVRKYSGEDRASMTGNTWYNVTDGMTLNAGEGYILHCGHADYEYITFTFPAVDNESMNNVFSYQDVELPLEIYPSEFAYNRSWNLVGNPYPSYFNINGNIEHNGIITVWGEIYDEWGYSNGKGYVAYSLLDDYYTLKPYESFFVQCPDDATSMLFKADGRSHANDYSGYSEEYRQGSSGDRKMYNFILKNEKFADKTRLVLNEAASVDYELSCDASKFMNDNNDVPQIYIYDNEVRYAINERPLYDGLISVGIRIGRTGEYTLTLDPKEEYEEKLVLYDKVTGDEIDILNESYTFTAEEGYDDERFVLVVTEPTVGVEENVILDINDSDVEVFDVFGRRVRTFDVKNGLYILKKGDKVQRYFISE